MSENWKDILEAVQGFKDNRKDHFPQADKMVEFFNQVSTENLVVHLEEIFQLFKQWPYNQHDDEAQNAIQIAMSRLICHLTPDRQFVLVKLGLRHLAEELDFSESDLNESGVPIPKWLHLWNIFATYKSLFKNYVQVRQLRSLAKKLCATHPFFKNYYFIFDQLILVPERMRMSRLERIKWFREIKKPKWLIS